MSDGERVPAIDLLVELDVDTTLVQSLCATPLGDRMVFDVSGGRFKGPRFAGRILASGGDWVTRTPGGSVLDVRLVLETDDGVGILFRYGGRASVRGATLQIEVAGAFDAPAGAYGWLNDLQAFGLGSATPTGVRYRFFRFI